MKANLEQGGDRRSFKQRACGLKTVKEATDEVGVRETVAEIAWQKKSLMVKDRNPMTEILVVYRIKQQELVSYRG